VLDSDRSARTVAILSGRIRAESRAGEYSHVLIRPAPLRIGTTIDRWEPDGLRYRPGHMPNARSAIFAVSTVVLAACAAGTASPSPTPSTPAPTLAIEHAKGATDVVLRMSTGGGFVPQGFLLTEAPEFTLYGDGTVVFRNPANVPTAPVPDDGVIRSAWFRTARLTEAQVQELLEFAIGPSGLGIARAQYDPCCVADAPSTTFTLRAGGLDKEVAVGALDFDDPQPGADSFVRKAFKGLAERLRNLDRSGMPSPAYVPAAYRGILFDAGGGGLAVPIRDWPWTAFGPDGFISPADPNGNQTPTRTLTADEVAELKVNAIEGGAQSIALRTSNGKIFLLGLRPLLPGEKS
jgi:hypothetical protein